MSAHVVDKTHIDLLVKAADHYGRKDRSGARFRWWRTDDEGNYTGWKELDPYAEELPSAQEWLERLTPSQLGQILLSENVRSVEHRYPDTDADAGDLPGPVDAFYTAPYVYEDPGYVLTPGEVFKAIDCLDYQSCETNDWRRSEAWFVLEALRNTVCRYVPGYEQGEWTWTASDLARKKNPREAIR